MREEDSLIQLEYQPPTHGDIHHAPTSDGAAIATKINVDWSLNRLVQVATEISAVNRSDPLVPIRGATAG